jgi:hypothetical protein
MDEQSKFSGIFEFLLYEGIIERFSQFPSQTLCKQCISFAGTQSLSILQASSRPPKIIKEDNAIPPIKKTAKNNKNKKGEIIIEIKIFIQSFMLNKLKREKIAKKQENKILVPKSLGLSEVKQTNKKKIIAKIRVYIFIFF